MKEQLGTIMRRQKQQGQTLIMAIIILGVLLLIGFVFIGIISRNITFAGRAQQRSIATDLAEAGVRFAHSQMLNSASGADWRPKGTPPISAADPDFDLLQVGGPDGLGAYSRVVFDNGRAVVRVRYAPSDANVFSATPAGALRQPGKVRNYLIIESFGRPGRVSPNDPTTLGTRDRRESRKVVAFVSLGTIEHARFIMNKYNVSRPAELGFPNESGARYDTAPVNVPVQIGGQYAGPGGTTVLGGGSLFSNADIVFHGQFRSLLNAEYGDSIAVAGTLVGADDNALLNIARYNGPGVVFDNYVLGNNIGLLNNNPIPNRLPSRDPNFTTAQGVLRDSIGAVDENGWTRHIARKEPPSILRQDPDTNLNRYVQLSRNSGALTANGNIGRWGHGRNPYVDNLSDVQGPVDEDGREIAGAQEALFYDWLNPNNGQQGSGWSGPFYVPVGAYIQLDESGFTIVRDGRATNRERTWRRPDGSDSGETVIRYRIEPNTDTPRIVNTFTPGVNINAANPGYQNGVPFDGVIVFEGNVRVRGVIPTDRQLTIVSMANIYIEGSITKGVIDTTGQRLNRPSRSMLGLMAKNYVVLNTTQIFGPTIGQQLDPVRSVPNAVTQAPVRMPASTGTLNFRTEFLLDPDSGLNPTTWTPFAANYRSFTNPASNTGPVITTNLLFNHTMDDGAAPNAFFSMDVNYGLGGANQWVYNFALTPSNAATPFYAPGTNYAPIYGLGSETWQRYAKFEGIGFPLIDPGGLTNAASTMQSTSPNGNYFLLLGNSSVIGLRSTNIGFASTNDYMMANAAVVPHDVRIEATIFAEEGSFFVIPGRWFNPNPNDRRDTYQALGSTPAEREQARLDAFGAFPEMPFYGEPNDVKVTIVGSIAENMPPPISQQAEWLKKWGWIPREHGATGRLIPWSHVPVGFDITAGDQYVPNLNLIYDPVLASGRLDGFANPTASATTWPTTYVRYDRDATTGEVRPLPPIPRLPVSPTLAYFGEVNP